MFELFQEWWERGLEENDRGVNSTTIYWIDCRKFVDSTMYPTQHYKNKLGRSLVSPAF
jgi:hypothetical protein